MPAATAAVIESAPDERAGLASGAINAARQVGSVIGVAVLGALVGKGASDAGGIRLALLIAAGVFLAGAALTPHGSARNGQLGGGGTSGLGFGTGVGGSGGVGIGGGGGSGNGCGDAGSGNGCGDAGSGIGGGALGSIGGLTAVDGCIDRACHSVMGMIDPPTSAASARPP